MFREIEAMAHLICDQNQVGKMICRQMREGEVLPFPESAIGWKNEQLDPRTVWVAEQYGAVLGAIVAAEVHKTLFLVRMLGSGGAWLRPLWRHIRHVCVQQKIVGVWAFLDNQKQSEIQLAKLLIHDSRTSGYEKWDTCSVVVGRWDAATDSAAVAGAADNGDRGGDLARSDGLRPGERWGIVEQLLRSGDSATATTGSADGSAAKSGAAGGGEQHQLPDRGELDTGGNADFRGQPGGHSASKSAVHLAIFGR